MRYINGMTGEIMDESELNDTPINMEYKQITCEHPNGKNDVFCYLVMKTI